jgi:hypothetical protein
MNTCRDHRRRGPNCRWKGYGEPQAVYRDDRGARYPKDFGQPAFCFGSTSAFRHWPLRTRFPGGTGNFEWIHSVLCGEPSHRKRQPAVGCHFNGGSINPPHVFCFVGTATVHFHNKFSILHVFHCFYSLPRKAHKNVPVLNPGKDSVVVDASSLHNTPVRCWKELKEVLTTHEHRNSLVRNPEFPSSHEACTQSLFEGHWNYGYGRSEHTHDHQMEVFLSPKPTSSRLFSR